jgi:HPt (histidine-containing phosphotransfer) domain-containing protein
LRTIAQHFGEVMRAPDSLTENPESFAKIDTSGTIYSTLGDQPGMNQIIAEFVGDFEEGCRVMQDLLDRNELKDLCRAIHQLRGAAGGYGFEQVTELAAQAETSIRSSAALDVIAAQTHELIGVIKRIEGFGKPKVSAAVK